MAKLKWLTLFLVVCHCSFVAHAQQDRAELVRKDLANFEQDEYWLYNNLDRGIAKAKQTGRPLLVVFR